MPTPTFIEIPDYNAISKKSGVLKDSTDIYYPLVRFDDTEASDVQTVTGSYVNGDIVGTARTFSNVAGDNNWSGAIQGATLNVSNIAVAADTFSLLLFAQSPTVTNDTLLTALSLVDAIADSFVGAITFANAYQLSNRTLFNAGSLNLKYTCDTSSKSLYGFLVLNSSTTRSLTGVRIATKLQVTRS